MREKWERGRCSNKLLTMQAQRPKAAQVTKDGQELSLGRSVLLTGGPCVTNIVISLGIHVGGERLGESLTL